MTETKPGGKGRPTPKRSEAERRRRAPITPAPTDRKAAARQRRKQLADRREEMRRALREGDERHYPPAHRGPERRFVRDLIDRRRGVAWLVIPGSAVLFALSLVPPLVVRAIGTLGQLLLIGMVLADTAGAAITLRRRIAAEFPGGTAEPRGRLVRYGMARNAMMRRFRTPPPGR